MRVERFPRKLDRNRRRIALHVGAQAGLHADELFCVGVGAPLQGLCHRPDEAIGEQHAHERTDERAADEVAENFGGSLIEPMV